MGEGKNEPLIIVSMADSLYCETCHDKGKSKDSGFLDYIYDEDKQSRIIGMRCPDCGKTSLFENNTERRSIMAKKYYSLSICEWQLASEFPHELLIPAEDEAEAKELSKEFITKSMNKNIVLKQVSETAFVSDCRDFGAEILSLTETTKEAFLQKLLQERLFDPKGKEAFDA